MENKTKDPPLKINGFTTGPTFYQFITYFIMLLKLGVFAGLIIPALKIYFQVIFPILLAVPYVMTVVFGYRATAHDPTDQVVYFERKSRMKNEPFDAADYNFYCDYCDTNVQDDSKHCRQCNRCVLGFDHHCKWVNNCVNKDNYRNFIKLLISVILSLFVFVVSAILYIVNLQIPNMNFLENADELEEEENFEVKYWIVFGSMCLLALFMLLLVRLLFFHIYLMRHKMTTYDYIINKSTEKKKKKKKKSKKGKRLKVQDARQFSQEEDDSERKSVSEVESPQNSNSNTRFTQNNKEFKTGSIDSTSKTKKVVKGQETNPLVAGKLKMGFSRFDIPKSAFKDSNNFSVDHEHDTITRTGTMDMFSHSNQETPLKKRALETVQVRSNHTPISGKEGDSQDITQITSPYQSKNKFHLKKAFEKRTNEMLNSKQDQNEYDDTNSKEEEKIQHDAMQSVDRDIEGRISIPSKDMDEDTLTFPNDSQLKESSNFGKDRLANANDNSSAMHLVSREQTREKMLNNNFFEDLNKITEEDMISMTRRKMNTREEEDYEGERPQKVEEEQENVSEDDDENKENSNGQSKELEDEAEEATKNQNDEESIEN